MFLGFVDDCFVSNSYGRGFSPIILNRKTMDAFILSLQL